MSGIQRLASCSSAHLLLQSTSQTFRTVRHNCPWHRNGYRPCFFPFKPEYKAKNLTVDRLLESRGGRLLVMRRMLRESVFLGYDVRPLDFKSQLDLPPGAPGPTREEQIQRRV